MFDEIIPTNRQEQRIKTHRRAECRVGTKLWAGVIHDLSDGGVFFQPLRCLTDGETIHSDDAWMVAANDDDVSLHVPNAVADDAPIVARVSWSGCSDLHRCGGLGLRFAQKRAFAGR